MDLIRGAATTLVFINTRAQAELFFQAPLGRRTTRACRSASTTARSAARRGSGSRRRWSRASCAPSSPPARSTSASTGATSTSWCRSARRRTSSAWCSASAAPTTATTRRRARCWCRPTASRCSNAAPRSTAVRAHDLDGEPRGPGPLDVLCQHILLTACAGPFDADALFAEVRDRRPLPRARRGPTSTPASTSAPPAATRCAPTTAGSGWCERDGRWQLRDPRRARAIRMNVGTIVDTETAEGPAQGPRRRAARRDRGGLRRHADARRHLPDRRRDGALRGPARDDRRGDPPAPRRDAEDRRLHRHQARHLDAALAPGGRAPRRPRAPGPGCPATCGTGWRCRREVSRLPAPGPAARRDLPARRARRTSASTASPAATPTRPSACW